MLRRILITVALVALVAASGAATYASIDDYVWLGQPAQGQHMTQTGCACPDMPCPHAGAGPGNLEPASTPEGWWNF